MKKRHEISATDDLARKANNIVNSLDYIITYMMKNVSSDTGLPLYTSLTELKADLLASGLTLKDIKAAISTFITKRQITFDISQYVDSNLTALNTKLTEVEALIDKIRTDIGKVSINTIDKVIAYAQTISNPMLNMSAVNYDHETRQCNIVNDLLDAMSYTLHGISPNDGSALNMSDAQLRTMVQGFMQAIDNVRNMVFTQADLKTDADAMFAVADYVMANINTIPLNDLGTYIDTNVPKLPLIRRNWA